MTRFNFQMLWVLPLSVGLLLGACAEQDDRPATFAYIHQAIIRPNCTTSACHSRLASTAGLNLERMAGAYFILVGSTCGQTLPGEAPGNFVFPNFPERSKLLRQLRGENTRRMPPDVALPDVDIDLIERWILAGAVCE